MGKQKGPFFAVSLKNTSMPYFWAMKDYKPVPLYLFDFSERFFVILGGGEILKKVSRSYFEKKWLNMYCECK